MPDIWFEDFHPGEVISYGSRTITQDEIIAFATDFDPQPFHLDPVAARNTFAGGLIASGWQTNGILHRMNCDAFLNRAACLGSPGIDEVRWVRPVRPGDSLSVQRTVLEAVPSQSKPDRGTIRFAYHLINQNGELVCQHDCRVMFARRTIGQPAPDAPRMARMPDVAPTETTRGLDPNHHLRPFEDIEIGTEMALGSYTFTAENVHAFALAYDPQGFHIDADVAASGPFGRIVASGWHTAAAWMSCMARDRAARTARTLAEGGTPARLGTSPGFRNLKFILPVAPGDTLAYRSRLIDKRDSRSRPAWGLVFHHNTATNQRGERVMEFTGSVFWERRQPSAAN